MKTPDEIKKGLELHNTAGRCKECPYTADSEFKKTCFQLVAADALAYIQQLETRLAQVERERDAAVNDLKLVRCCGTCVNNEGGCTTECYIVSGTLTGWEWRGVCDENTKEDA